MDNTLLVIVIFLGVISTFTLIFVAVILYNLNRVIKAIKKSYFEIGYRISRIQNKDLPEASKKYEIQKLEYSQVIFDMLYINMFI